MFAQLLPVIVLAGAALLIPLFILMATKEREGYCGGDLRHCFWCGRDCEYYRLDKPAAK